MSTNLCAVTVTYGKRTSYAIKLVESLCSSSMPPSLLVIVVNGPGFDENKFISSTHSFNINVELVRIENNQGSAVGYSVGVDRAISTGVDFIFLIDDDNFVDKFTIQNALISFKELKSYSIISCFRNSRSEYDKMLRGDVRDQYENGSFLNFNIGKWFFSQRNKNIGEVRNLSIGKCVRVAHAPYGGMLIPSSILRDNGFNNKDFILYADDHEFCTRMSRIGISVWLIGGAVVMDQEESWDREERSCHQFYDINVPNWKIYYSIRNRVYMQKNYYKASGFLYKINVAIYFAFVFFSSLSVLRDFKFYKERTALVRRAYCDGMNGRLGMTYEISLCK